MPAQTDYCLKVLNKLSSEGIRPSNIIAHDQGTAALLVSEQNLQGLPGFQIQRVQSLRRASGHNWEVLVRYLPRGPRHSAAVTDTVCDPGVRRSYLEETYPIDKITKSNVLELSYDQVRDFCESKNTHLSDLIGGEMGAIRSQWDFELVEEILANRVGNFANAEAPGKTIPLFTADGLRINPTGESTIQVDMSRAEVNGGMVKIGANLLQHYIFHKGISCCNDRGFDAGRLAQLTSPVVDTNIDVQLGNTSNILVIRPGALQLLFRNNNLGEFAISNEGGETRTVMPDPVFPGVLYDLRMRWVTCDDLAEGDNIEDMNLRIQLSLRWGLWGYAADQFDAADPLFGVTDVFHYRGICSDDTPCELFVS